MIRQYLSQTKPYDIIVLEYGVDHVGEMDVLIDSAQADFGVITNIDKCILETQQLHDRRSRS